MSETVLICDDESHVLWALEYKFRKAGFTVITAEHGEDAWQAIIDHKPDIVITDCVMPVLNGYELAERIRHDERTAHLPIIFLTATAANSETREAAERFSIAHIEPKPFSPKGMLALTRQTISDAPSQGV